MHRCVYFVCVGVCGCASVLMCVILLRLIRVDISAPRVFYVRVLQRATEGVREMERV